MIILAIVAIALAIGIYYRASIGSFLFTVAIDLLFYVTGIFLAFTEKNIPIKDKLIHIAVATFQNPFYYGKPWIAKLIDKRGTTK